MTAQELRDKLRNMQPMMGLIEVIEAGAMTGKPYFSLLHTDTFPNLDLDRINHNQIGQLRRMGYKIRKDSGVSKRWLISGWL